MPGRPEARLRVLLLRHGDASGTGSDPALSASGRAELVRSLDALPGDAFGPPALVLHSPLRRAVESAARVRARWPRAAARAHAGLLPEARADAAGRWLLAAAADARCDALVVIAHLPLLPALLGWLCDGTPAAGRAFATGCGWLLSSGAETAWQGTFTVERAVEHGGTDGGEGFASGTGPGGAR